MRVVRHEDIPAEPFPGGADYRTLVGGAAGAAPIRVGIQVSPPGYRTPDHAHPYLEVLTVLEGTGEAWSADREGVVMLEPGVTLALEPGVRHGFRATGAVPLKTLGIHASPDRIVETG